MKIKVSNVNTPNWKEVTVKSRIPVELESCLLYTSDAADE